MKQNFFKSIDIYQTEPELCAEMSIGDVAYSLRKFIENTYRGRVIFSRQNFNENATVLFDSYDFARMIKSVIKELTLEHTCMIFFASTPQDFTIGFEAHKENPISERSALYLRAEGERLGISVKTDANTVRLSVPTRKLALTALYEHDTETFYRILCSVLEEA